MFLKYSKVKVTTKNTKYFKQFDAGRNMNVEVQ